MRKPYPSRAAGLSAAVLGVLSSIAPWFGGADRAVQAQSDARYGDVPMDLGAVAVELTLGLNDTEPTDWSDGFRLPARRVLAIEGAESAGDTGLGSGLGSNSNTRGAQQGCHLADPAGASDGNAVRGRQ